MSSYQEENTLTIITTGMEDNKEKPSTPNQPDDECWMYSDRESCAVKEDILALCRESLWCDVHIKIDDKSFGVHKAILTAACPMFNAMFRHCFKESLSNEIDFSCWFKNIDAAKDFIGYLYTGRIRLTNENILSMINVAHMALLHPLEDHCSQFLFQRLSNDNVIDTIKLAIRYEKKDLLKICCRLLERIEPFLPRSPEILNMKYQHFKRFLTLDMVRKFKDTIIAEMVLHWITRHFSKRFQCGIKLLSTQSVPEYMIEGLLLSHGKKDKLRKALTTIKVQKNSEMRLCFNNDDVWTVVVQETSGKTAMYSPNSRSWHVMKLPSVKGQLVGIFEEYKLAYFNDDLNIITCVNLKNKMIKETFVVGSRSQKDIANLPLDCPTPYRYFCFSDTLYSINPILSEDIITGWGMYRYSSKNDNWTLIFDVIYERDFPICPPFKVLVINDTRAGFNSHKPIASVFLHQQPSSQLIGCTFMYFCQHTEFSTFTVSSDMSDNFIHTVFPEICFLSLQEKLVGLKYPLSNLEFYESETEILLTIPLVESTDSCVSGKPVKLILPKPEVLPVEQAHMVSPLKYSHSQSPSTCYNVANGLKIFLFGCKLFMVTCIQPLDFQMFLYDLGDSRLIPLPPVPLNYHPDVRVIPIRITESVSTLLGLIEDTDCFFNDNDESRFKWALSTWRGVFMVSNSDDCSVPDKIATTIE